LYKAPTEKFGSYGVTGAIRVLAPEEHHMSYQSIWSSGAITSYLGRLRLPQAMEPLEELGQI
jgi:hypothetical protein